MDFARALKIGLASVKERQEQPLPVVYARFASKVGYSESTVDAWCRGRTVPPDAARIAEKAIVFCHNEGTINGTWALDLLNSARHPAPTSFMDSVPGLVADAARMQLRQPPRLDPLRTAMAGRLRQALSAPDIDRYFEDTQSISDYVVETLASWLAESNRLTPRETTMVQAAALLALVDLDTLVSEDGHVECTLLDGDTPPMQASSPAPDATGLQVPLGNWLQKAIAHAGSDTHSPDVADDDAAIVALISLGARDPEQLGMSAVYRTFGTGATQVRTALLAALLNLAALIGWITTAPSRERIKELAEKPDDVPLYAWLRYYLRRPHVEHQGHIRFHFALPAEMSALPFQVLLSGLLQRRLRSLRDTLADSGLVIVLDSVVETDQWQYVMPAAAVERAKEQARKDLESLALVLARPRERIEPAYVYSAVCEPPILCWRTQPLADRFVVNLWCVTVDGDGRRSTYAVEQQELSATANCYAPGNLQPGCQYEWSATGYHGRRRLDGAASGSFWLLTPQRCQSMATQLQAQEPEDDSDGLIQRAQILAGFGCYGEAQTCLATSIESTQPPRQVAAMLHLSELLLQVADELSRQGHQRAADEYVTAALYWIDQIKASLAVHEPGPGAPR